MALTNDQITALNFKDFYNQIRPYLNGEAHSAFMPVGTVISLMGNTAPLNFLACDGTVYNIANYPQLANYFAEQFGTKNYFGGDGITTFAVPDLQGEFLRGAGTNSHTNQGSGGDVGDHQDATEHPYVQPDIEYTNQLTFNTSAFIDKTDHIKAGTTIAYYDKASIGSTTSAVYTSRPTNTSVLYCIAIKNIYMNPENIYSTDEAVVGKWIDGKPLYHKVITVSGTFNTMDAEVTDVSSLNIDELVDLRTLDHSHFGSVKFAIIPFAHPEGDWSMTVYINNNNKICVCPGKYMSLVNPTFILQYTKTTD